MKSTEVNRFSELYEGRIPIFPVMPLALYCACLLTVSSSFSAYFFKTGKMGMGPLLEL